MLFPVSDHSLNMFGWRTENLSKEIIFFRTQGTSASYTQETVKYNIHNEQNPLRGDLERKINQRFNGLNEHSNTNFYDSSLFGPGYFSFQFRGEIFVNADSNFFSMVLHFKACQDTILTFYDLKKNHCQRNVIEFYCTVG